MHDFRPHIRTAVELLGSQEKLAAAIGVSQPSVHYLCTQAKALRAEVALAIETATDGRVTRHQLRPDLWPPADAKRVAA